jgi:Raf kinase inhibitor-like YbhB/YbcL family protein
MKRTQYSFGFIVTLMVALAACGKAPAATTTTEPHSAATSDRAATPAAAPLSVALTAKTTSFTLTSPEVAEGGALPTEYTCDGDSSTLPLAWSGAPTETQSFAVIMHHVASPEDVHWYWVVYNIPASVTSLAKNSVGGGTLGTNSVNDRAEYTPPCSKGPGPKVYTYTVYALSAQPQLSVPASQVDRDTLLAAIRGITLASAELHVTYTRESSRKPGGLNTLDEQRR